MMAIAALVAFAIALILHVVGHGVASYVTDFVIGGLLLLTLHIGWALPVIPRRPAK